MPEFKMQLHHLLVLWPWANHVLSLSFSFFTCKRELKKLTPYLSPWWLDEKVFCKLWRNLHTQCLLSLMWLMRLLLYVLSSSCWFCACYMMVSVRIAFLTFLAHSTHRLCWFTDLAHHFPWDSHQAPTFLVFCGFQDSAWVILLTSHLAMASH